MGKVWCETHYICNEATAIYVTAADKTIKLHCLEQLVWVIIQHGFDATDRKDAIQQRLGTYCGEPNTQLTTSALKFQQYTCILLKRQATL